MKQLGTKKSSAAYSFDFTIAYAWLKCIIYKAFPHPCRYSLSAVIQRVGSAMTTRKLIAEFI
jgi:hypothetical protein